MSDIEAVHAEGAQEVFFDCTAASVLPKSRILDLLERSLPAVLEITR